MRLSPIDPEDRRLSASERQILRNIAYRLDSIAQQAVLANPPEDYQRKAARVFRTADGDL